MKPTRSPPKQTQSIVRPGRIEISAKLTTKHDTCLPVNDKQTQSKISSLESIAKFYSDQCDLFEKDKFLLSLEVQRLSTALAETNDYRNRTPEGQFSSFSNNNFQVHSYHFEQESPHTLMNPPSTQPGSLLDDYALQVSILRKELEGSKEIISSKDKNLRYLHEEIKMLESEKASLTDSLHYLKNQLDESRTKNKGLETQLNQIKSGGQSELETLYNKLSVKDSQISELNRRLHEKDQAVVEAQKNLIALRKKITGKEDNLFTELETLKKEVAAIQIKNKTEIDLIRQQHISEKSSLEASYQAIQYELEDFQRAKALEIQHLKSELSSKSTLIELMQVRQKRALSITLTFIAKVQDIAEDFNDNIDLLETKLNELKARVHLTKRKVQNQNKEIARVKLSSEEDNRRRIKTLDQQLKSFREEVRSIIQELNGQVQTTKEENAMDITAAKTDLNELKYQLENQKLLIKSKESEAEELNNMIGELQAMVDKNELETQAKVQSLEATVSELRSQIESQKSVHLFELQKTEESEKQKTAEIEELRKNLEAFNLSARKENEQLEGEYNEKITKLDQDYRTKLNDIENLHEAEKISLSHQLQSLQAELDQLKEAEQNRCSRQGFGTTHSHSLDHNFPRQYKDNEIRSIIERNIQTVWDHLMKIEVYLNDELRPEDSDPHYGPSKRDPMNNHLGKKGLINQFEQTFGNKIMQNEKSFSIDEYSSRNEQMALSSLGPYIKHSNNAEQQRDGALGQVSLRLYDNLPFSLSNCQLNIERLFQIVRQSNDEILNCLPSQIKALHLLFTLCQNLKGLNASAFFEALNEVETQTKSIQRAVMGVKSLVNDEAKTKVLTEIQTLVSEKHSQQETRSDIIERIRKTIKSELSVIKNSIRRIQESFSNNQINPRIGNHSASDAFGHPIFEKETRGKNESAYQLSYPTQTNLEIENRHLLDQNRHLILLCTQAGLDVSNNSWLRNFKVDHDWQPNIPTTNNANLENEGIRSEKQLLIALFALTTSIKLFDSCTLNAIESYEQFIKNMARQFGLDQTLNGSSHVFLVNTAQKKADELEMILIDRARESGKNIQFELIPSNLQKHNDYSEGTSHFNLFYPNNYRSQLGNKIGLDSLLKPRLDSLGNRLDKFHDQNDFEIRNCNQQLSWLSKDSRMVILSNFLNHLYFALTKIAGNLKGLCQNELNFDAISDEFSLHQNDINFSQVNFSRRREPEELSSSDYIMQLQHTVQEISQFDFRGGCEKLFEITKLLESLVRGVGIQRQAHQNRSPSPMGSVSVLCNEIAHILKDSYRQIIGHFSDAVKSQTFSRTVVEKIILLNEKKLTRINFTSSRKLLETLRSELTTKNNKIFDLYVQLQNCKDSELKMSESPDSSQLSQLEEPTDLLAHFKQQSHKQSDLFGKRISQPVHTISNPVSYLEFEADRSAYEAKITGLASKLKAIQAEQKNLKNDSLLIGKHSNYLSSKTSANDCDYLRHAKDSKLDGKINVLSLEIDRLRELNGKLQSQLSESDKEFQKVKLELATQKSRFALKDKETQKLEQMIGELQNKCVLRKAKLAGLRQKFLGKSSELEDANQQITILSSELSEMRVECEVLRQQLAERSQHIKTMVDKIRHLELKYKSSPGSLQYKAIHSEQPSGKQPGKKPFEKFGGHSYDLSDEDFNF